MVSVVLSGLGFNNTFSVDQSEPRAITYELNFSEFGAYAAGDDLVVENLAFSDGTTFEPFSVQG